MPGDGFRLGLKDIRHLKDERLKSKRLRNLMGDIEETGISDFDNLLVYNTASLIIKGAIK